MNPVASASSKRARVSAAWCDVEGSRARDDGEAFGLARPSAAAAALLADASFSDAGRDAPGKTGLVDRTKALLSAVRSGAGFSPGLRDGAPQVEWWEARCLRQTEKRIFQTR